MELPHCPCSLALEEKFLFLILPTNILLLDSPALCYRFLSSNTHKNLLLYNAFPPTLPFYYSFWSFQYKHNNCFSLHLLLQKGPDNLLSLNSFSQGASDTLNPFYVFHICLLLLLIPCWPHLKYWPEQTNHTKPLLQRLQWTDLPIHLPISLHSPRSCFLQNKPAVFHKHHIPDHQKQRLILPCSRKSISTTLSHSL